MSLNDRFVQRNGQILFNLGFGNLVETYPTDSQLKLLSMVLPRNIISLGWTLIQPTYSRFVFFINFLKFVEFVFHLEIVGYDV